MLTKTYPRGYEMISFWRFRKYSLRLFAVAAAFTALFTAMVYAAGLINIKENYQQAQFYIELYPGGYRYDDYMGEELLGIPGVTEIIKWDATSALYMKSHIAVENRNVPLLSTFPMTEDEKRATNLAVYIGADEETLGYLSDYDITGDPRSIFENERTVIVTDSTNLSRKLKIKPGDKIWVGLYMDKIVDTPPNLSEHDLLREQLRVYKFTYAEFTVGAVSTTSDRKEISCSLPTTTISPSWAIPHTARLQLNVDQS